MTKIKKKHKVLKIIIIVSAMLIVLLGVMRYLFGNKEVMFGANVNSMSYSKDISPQNYSSVDEAMKTVDEKLNSEEKICQIEENGVVHVYVQGINTIKDKNGKVDQIRQYVSCYDFIVVSKGYNYSGVRDLAIGLNKEKEYSWKDTFLADLSQSRLSGLEKQYGVLPAWGVTDYSDISNVTVDDQKIDEVHELDVDGKTYYLWIINDLKTQNEASEVRIEYPKPIKLHLSRHTYGNIRSQSQSLKQLHDVMTDRLHHSRKVDAAAVVFFEESRCKQAAVVRQI